MKTIRRDKLRQLAEAGRLAMIEGYSFDDMYGATRTQGVRMPVEMIPDDRSQCRDGTCYVFPSDFKSQSGGAYDAGTTPEGNQLVCLHVHSNCNYTFMVKEVA